MNNTKYAVGLYSLPPYQPVYMHPAVAYLAGSIKKELPDVIVHQEDLNASSLEYFLGKDAISPMRDLAVYHDFEKFRAAKRKIAEGVQMATNGKLAVVRNSIDFDSGDDYKSRQGLINTVDSKEKILYYKFFRDRVLPQVESEGMGLVGLSVSDQKQFVPAVVLSSMIKEQLGDKVKVVLGGNIVTRNYDVLSRDDEFNRRLFGYFDFLVHHEGETAIVGLVRALKQGGDVSGVPKLVYTRDGRVVENLDFVVENVNQIPAPDFDGFINQGNHWTPQPVIPYLIGRGCDWGGCSFCDIPTGYDGSRRRVEKETGKKFNVSGEGAGKRRNQNLDKVVSELKELSKKYRTKYFSFGDEELAGDLLRGFVDKTLESGLGIEWECYGRIEDLYLDKNFCERLRRAGCRFIQFGLESASQAVLDANRKGYQFQTARNVLRNTHEAGIMNHAFILTGLPGDTLAESSKLIRFLEESGEFLTTIKPISYKVSKWSPIALTPEKFGVKLNREHTPDLEQRINVGKDSGMMSRHKAMAFTRLLELWVARNHKVNPATSEYAYVQRLFLTKEKLEEFGNTVDYQVHFSPEDRKALAKVYNGLVEEVKLLAYSEGISREQRQRFSKLFDKLRRGEADKSFDGVVKLAGEVVDIQK